MLLLQDMLPKMLSMQMVRARLDNKFCINNIGLLIMGEIVK